MNRFHRPIALLAILGGALIPAGCRPPSADLKEVYDPGAPTSQSVDHSLLNAVLKEFVNGGGRVDYARLRTDRKNLDSYTESLKGIDFETLSRDGKLTLLINAYNAFTLTLILDSWPVNSIKDIPDAERWQAKRFRIGTLRLSLNDIEQTYLRSKFKEPRIHFAINCASIGCPPLRNEAYRVEDIDAQLAEQARWMHNNKSWFDLDAAHSVLNLTKLYDWYGGDFEQVSGTKLAYAAQFNEELAALLAAGKPPAIHYLDYDWGLNKQ